MIATIESSEGVSVDAPTALETLIEEAQAAAARQTAEYISMKGKGSG